MSRVQKVQLWGKSRAVIIPRQICRDLLLCVGDLVSFHVVNNCVVIQKFEPPAPPSVTAAPPAAIVGTKPAPKREQLPQYPIGETAGGVR